MKVCIFGVSGQDGTYLTEHLQELGCDVIGVARRSSQPRNNLLPMIKKGLKLIEGDITDYVSVEKIIREYQPDWCFDLAAMSHVGSSFSTPLSTFDITGRGVLNILESIRTSSPKTKLYHASSSEQFGSAYSIRRKYGDEEVVEHFDYKKVKPNNLIEDVTNQYYFPFQNESTPFYPKSPYSVAKTAAHYSVALYRDAYDMFACSGILLNHESPRRGQNFVTRKITEYVGRLVLAKKQNKIIDKLQMGNIFSYRDWSHSADMVKAMVLMLEKDTPKDYVVGSGSTKTVREFLELAFKYAGENWEEWVEISQEFIRPAEVDYLRADPSLAKKELGWVADYSFEELVREMVEFDIILAERL